MRSAARCLVLAARHHALDVTVERLSHDYALGEAEPSQERLLRIAQEIGLRARKARLGIKDLAAIGQAFPIIARLRDGQSVLIVGVREEEAGSVALLLDPTADQANIEAIPFVTLPERWDGDAILVKRHHEADDKDLPFGFRLFVAEMMRHKAMFLQVGVIALLLHALALAVPIYMQIVFDKVVGNQVEETLYVVAIGVVIALLFNAVLGLLRGGLLLYATSKIDVRISTRTFDRLMSLPIGFFRTISAGVLAKHMQQTGRVREFLTGKLFITLLDLTALFVFVPVLYFYSPLLLGVVLAITALIALNMLFVRGIYQRNLERLYEAEGRKQSLLVESIHGIETVKSMALEPNLRRDWDGAVASVVSSNFDVGRVSMITSEISGFLQKLMMVALIFFGARMAFTGEMSVGALIAFNMLAARVSGPLVALVNLYSEFQQSSLSVSKLADVMNRPLERQRKGGLTPEILGRIEFDNVTFRYKPEAPTVLDQVSFTVPAGKVVGIVGRSGSGKSTIARLLQGLYTPHSGLIRLDAFDMREIDLQHLRMNIGVVLQESFLFRGSVRENIARSNPAASLGEVVRAARLAGAEEFIEKLPQGYETPLEEGASNLSGGQKQRLSIARALIRQPRILILDEATSALDPESEAIVQRNMQRMAAGRTLVVISHRLASLVDADIILVVDQGALVALGRHAELLRSCHVYRTLWEQQSRTDLLVGAD